MNNKNEYYDNLAERVREILGNETYIKLSEGYAVVKGKEEHTYFINARYTITHEQQNENHKVIAEFVKDFRNHLINDTPFTVLGSDSHNVHQHFLKLYAEFLFDSGRRNINNNSEILPTLQEFEKAAKCFENILPSMDMLISRLHQTYGGTGVINFIPIILSLDNKSTYVNETNYTISENIKNDLASLAFHFNNEKSPVLREGISHYLNNKKEFLNQIKDRNVELEILSVIKYLLHSDYWAEVASQLPNLNVKKEKAKPTSDKLFSLSTNPIYQIDLNKNNISSYSSFIITEEDFSNMIFTIDKSITLHKPNNVDFIQIVGNGDKIIVAGKDVNHELAIGIADIFEKMIFEYTNNVPQIPYPTEEQKKDVQKYLNKVAEVLWLELDLSKDNESKPKRRSKL